MEYKTCVSLSCNHFESAEIVKKCEGCIELEKELDNLRKLLKKHLKTHVDSSLRKAERLAEELNKASKVDPEKLNESMDI